MSQFSKDYLTLVSHGSIPGHELFHIHGRQPDLDDSNDFITIWALKTTMVFPTTDRIHSITSTSAADTLAGTGAQTMDVIGVSGGVITEETVNMNAGGGVNTASAYSWLRLKVATTGSGNENAGAISATAATDAKVTSVILAGLNRSMDATFLVPDNRTAYIMDPYSGIVRDGVAASEVRLLTSSDGLTWSPELTLSANSRGGANDHIDKRGPIKLEAGTYIRMDGDTTSNNTVVTAGFTLLLIVI